MANMERLHREARKLGLRVPAKIKKADLEATLSNEVRSAPAGNLDRRIRIAVAQSGRVTPKASRRASKKYNRDRRQAAQLASELGF